MAQGLIRPTDWDVFLDIGWWICFLSWVEQTLAPPPLFGMPVVVRDLLALLNNALLHRLLGPAVMQLLYSRLGRLCGTLERLMAQFQAGTLRQSGPRAGAVRVERFTWPRPARIWPVGFGWLAQMSMMGYRARGYGSQLQHILEQPEMAALLAASPQARRVLRPICRMLMVRNVVITPARAVPEKAAPKKRVRAPRPKMDWGRIPLPRGVITAIRRDRFCKSR